MGCLKAVLDDATNGEVPLNIIQLTASFLPCDNDKYKDVVTALNAVTTLLPTTSLVVNGIFGDNEDNKFDRYDFRKGCRDFNDKIEPFVNRDGFQLLLDLSEAMDAVLSIERCCSDFTDALKERERLERLLSEQPENGWFKRYLGDAVQDAKTTGEVFLKALDVWKDNLSAEAKGFVYTIYKNSQ